MCSVIPTCFLPLRYVSFASSIGFLSVTAMVIAQIHTGLATYVPSFPFCSH